MTWAIPPNVFCSCEASRHYWSATATPSLDCRGRARGLPRPERRVSAQIGRAASMPAGRRAEEFALQKSYPESAFGGGAIVRRARGSRLEKRGIVERLDHGVDHVGGAVVFALFQKLPHLAQVGAHRRLQRRVALDQGARDAEGNAFGAHPCLLDGGFAHGRLLVDLGVRRAGAAVRSNRSSGIAGAGGPRDGKCLTPTPPSPRAWPGRPAAFLPSGSCTATPW